MPPAPGSLLDDAPATTAAVDAQRLERIAQHVPGLLFQFRREPGGQASFPYVSERCQDLLGVPAQVLRGNAAAMLRRVDRAQRDAMLASIAASAAALTPWRLQFCVWHRGQRRCMRGSATPQWQEDGAVIWHGYIEDVSELLQLEQAQQDKAAAEASSRAKSVFLSQMSHELRTPLNAVLGFAQLMELDRQDPPTPRQRERLALIRDAGAHLLKMVGDLLDLSRIESGDQAVVLAPTPAAALVRQVLDMMSGTAQASGVSLAAGPGAETDALRVNADPTRLRQVLLNLVSNAIKYNRPGGHVRVAVEPTEDGSAIDIAVSDDGPGISTQDQPQVFDAFFRSRQVQAVAGVGLGLSVSQALVQAMGGHIALRSQPGEGAVFSVVLPRA